MACLVPWEIPQEEACQVDNNNNNEIASRNLIMPNTISSVSASPRFATSLFPTVGRVGEQMPVKNAPRDVISNKHRIYELDRRCVNEDICKHGRKFNNF